MAVATGTKVGDVTNGADAKNAIRESEQANVAYARMLVDESASGTRAGTEKTMDQMNRAAGGMFKAAEEAAAFGRGNAEALAKSAQAYVSGVQDLSRQTMAMVQGLTDSGARGRQGVQRRPQPQGTAEIQAGLARSAFERDGSESTKLQETALKVAEQSFAPLSARMTAAVEKMGRPLAPDAEPCRAARRGARGRS
jgi:hypothetical protein